MVYLRIMRSNLLFRTSLISLTLMILGMIIIGGLTRLTGSGLSIVEWKPVTGIFPPLTIAEWIVEFQKYQQSPEFQKINFGITLSDFQSIYWLEYIHRLWGRLLGVVLFVPTLIVAFKGKYRKFWPYILTLWVLGGLQGLMGWLMVKSGLMNDPHVSPYRLTAHLILGLGIFGVSMWTTLLLYKEQLTLRFNIAPYLKNLTLASLVLVILTIMLGGLVAGFKAGLIYNTFPLMGKQLIPKEFLSVTPWWNDLLENPVTIQFIHRCLATTTVLLCLGLWFYQKDMPLPKLVSNAYISIAICAFLQFTLGILTLLLMVPVEIATLHQGFAFVLFGSLLFAFFLLHKRET